MMTMTGHEFRSSIGSEVGKTTQRKIVQHAVKYRTHKTKAALVKPTKPVTLFERTMKLSSEFHVLNADTCCESLRGGIEQRRLRFGEAARSRSTSTSSHYETHQMQSVEGDKGTGGATFFADDDFDQFCKSLMGTELNDDDSSDVIALAGPPPDVSFKSVVVSEDESDDLVMLDGPPTNVCFSRRTGTPQDERLQFQFAEPPAKRAKLTIPCENSAPEDQQSTRFPQGPENSISETDGMIVEESAQHRSTLPIDGKNGAIVGSQEPQAQLELFPNQIQLLWSGGTCRASSLCNQRMIPPILSKGSIPT